MVFPHSESSPYAPSSSPIVMFYDSFSSSLRISLTHHSFHPWRWLTFPQLQLISIFRDLYICSSGSDLSFELYIHIPSCLLDVSTWTSHNLLKINSLSNLLRLSHSCKLAHLSIFPPTQSIGRYLGNTTNCLLSIVNYSPNLVDIILNVPWSYLLFFLFSKIS